MPSSGDSPLPDPFDTPDDQLGQMVRRGIPEGWGELADGPLRERLPDPGWGKLLFRYAGLGPSDALDHIFHVTVGKQNPTRVILEGGYIDADYRDEFSH